MCVYIYTYALTYIPLFISGTEQTTRIWRRQYLLCSTISAVSLPVQGPRTSAKQQPSNPSAAGSFKTNQLCVVNSIYVVKNPWTMRLTFWKVIGRLYHS